MRRLWVIALTLIVAFSMTVTVFASISKTDIPNTSADDIISGLKSAKKMERE